MIIMLTGSGGVFGRVLINTGVGEALVSAMTATKLPIVVFACLVATVVRVPQGSATVATVTAAGTDAPLIQLGDYSAPLSACLGIATPCGATALAHVLGSGCGL